MTDKLRAVQEEAREMIRDSIVEDAISRFIAQILEVAAKDKADRVAATLARAERAEALLKEAVDAMEWYDPLLLRCNAHSDEGHVARDKLARDRGHKLRLSLARIQEKTK